MLGLLPFVEDPDLSVSAARATSATLARPPTPLVGTKSQVCPKIFLDGSPYGQMLNDTAIINHLVHELLVTDGARMGEVALVPVLAPLQGSVVAKLLPTLLADIPATFLFTKHQRAKDG